MRSMTDEGASKFALVANASPVWLRQPPSPASGRGEEKRPLARPFNTQTILIDMSGSFSILQRSTSPLTTGPTFSGVPE
jgi:hypothetical protein